MFSNTLYRWRSRQVVLLLLFLALAGCGSDLESDDDRNKEAVPSSPTIVPLTPESATQLPATIDPILRPTLENQYERLRQTQQEIEGIWTDLRDGRTASCATPVAASVAPEAVTGQDVVSLALYRAAVEIDDAVSLWIGECQNPRQQPPADVIDRGVRAALAAGDALRDAEQALSR